MRLLGCTSIYQALPHVLGSPLSLLEHSIDSKYAFTTVTRDLPLYSALLYPLHFVIAKNVALDHGTFNATARCKHDYLRVMKITGAIVS